VPACCSPPDDGWRVLASRFSNCTAYRFELVAAGVSGDLAYTVGIIIRSVASK